MVKLSETERIEILMMVGYGDTKMFVIYSFYDKQFC
jgi:hypothetical protein